MLAVLILGTLLAQTAPEPSPLPSPGMPVQDGNPPQRLPMRSPMLASGPDDAVIVNSGSTNYSGYTVVIHPDFSAEIAVNGKTRQATIPEAQAKWLFAKLEAAMPLDSLTMRRCMKSASFGTTTTIAYHGNVTPDLSCGAGATGGELARTAAVITSQLKIVPALRHGFRRFPR